MTKEDKTVYILIVIGALVFGCFIGSSFAYYTVFREIERRGIYEDEDHDLRIVGTIQKKEYPK